MGKRNFRLIVSIFIILWLLSVITIFQPKNSWKHYFFHKSSNRMHNLNLDENRLTNIVSSLFMGLKSSSL